MESIWQSGLNPAQQRATKGNCGEISGGTGPEGKEVSSRHISSLYGHWATDTWLVEAHLQFCYCAEVFLKSGKLSITIAQLQHLVAHKMLLYNHSRIISAS